MKQSALAPKNLITSMGSLFSLFTDVGPIPPQYRVFINFRGEELRKGFLGFLVDDMEREKVNVFTDEHELRGTNLDNLFCRIEESRVAVTIFSKNFTESEWCLNELAKIKECMDRGSITVIPIFFKMKTDDVKRLRGKFGDNFRVLLANNRRNQETCRRWTEAIHSVSRITGLSSSRYSRQNDLVKTTVQEVIRVLYDISERERQKLEEKRNHFSAKTDELIKLVFRYISLIILLTVVIGPYVLGLISVFSIILGRFIISRAVESEW